MAIQSINIGTTPNDNTGDSGREAGVKINDNFSYVVDLINELGDQIENFQVDVGAGTVVSVGATGTNGLVVAGSPITGTGSFTLSVNANDLLAHIGLDGVLTALTGKQPLATVLTNTTAAFTTAQETKLAAIATAATANSSDAFLLARANHTGVQAISTVTDLQTELDDKASMADAVPLALATVTQIKRAESGFIYINPERWAEALSVFELDTPGATITVDGFNGQNQSVTILGDVEIDDIVNAPYGRYTIAVVGGAGAPYDLTFDARFLLPAEMPGETAPGSGIILIDEGETFVFDIIYSVSGDDIVTIQIRNCNFVGSPPDTAPIVQSSTITPEEGTALQVFIGSESVSGSPVPARTYLWKINDETIGGATAKDYTATSGQDGRFERVITATNSVSADSDSAFSFIGPPQPVRVGEEIIFSYGAGSVTLSCPLPAGTLEGDMLLALSAHNASANLGWPTDFVGLSSDGQIARLNSTGGNNTRMGAAVKVVTAGDISAGLIAGFFLSDNSMISLSTWRGVDHFDWNHTLFTRSTALAANGVAVNVRTSSGPCYAVLFTASSDYVDQVKESVVTGWTEGAEDDISPANGIGRHGLKMHYRRRPTGAIPSGTVTNAAGLLDSTWTTTTLFAYGIPT